MLPPSGYLYFNVFSTVTVPKEGNVPVDLKAMATTRSLTACLVGGVPARHVISPNSVAPELLGLHGKPNTKITQ